MLLMLSVHAIILAMRWSAGISTNEATLGEISRFEEAEAWFARRPLDDSAPGEEVLDAAIECGRLLLESAHHIAEQRHDTLVLGFAKSFQAIALREIKELAKLKALGYF